MEGDKESLLHRKHQKNLENYKLRKSNEKYFHSLFQYLFTTLPSWKGIHGLKYLRRFRSIHFKNFLSALFTTHRGARPKKICVESFQVLSIF